MKEYSPKRRTAVVFTGTGVSGAYHAGVLRALDESGAKIDVVVGSGAGCVTAAFAAVAGGARLYGPQGFWDEAGWSSFYRLRPALRAGVLLLAMSFGVFLLPLALALVAGLLFPLGLLLDLVAPAAAQRAGENAVRAADDAFGTSVGNERVGLYSPFGARGFSPVQAGNVRIEGLYFDYQADLNDRVISGSNVRVGLSAQSYPFPAPTGVGDFSLRKPGDEAVLSVVGGLGPFGGLRVELDGQLPVTETPSSG